MPVGRDYLSSNLRSNSVFEYDPDDRNPFALIQRQGMERQVSVSLHKPDHTRESYRVLVRGGIPPHHMTYSFEVERYLLLQHVMDFTHNPVIDMLDEGREIVLEWNDPHGHWYARAREVTHEGTPMPLSPQATSARSEADSRLIARLRRETREAKAETALMQERAERAERELTTANAAKQHAESTLSDLDTLRRTAVVWRDSRNGSRAKLNAFKDFCEALDSLPVPQDA